MSIALTQTVALYASMSLTTFLYIHLHVLGESPHIGPTVLLHCMNAAVAFCVTLSNVSVIVSLASQELYQGTSQC